MKKLITVFLLATIHITANAKKGINIIPLAQMNVPTSMKNEILLNNRSLIATKGYRETTNTNQSVISLFTLQRTAKKEISEFDDNQNPYDTHLKSNPSKIKLAFNFKEIPGLKKENIIGYAAAGGYIKNKGWDGIVAFFTNSKLGTCSYTTYGIEKVVLDNETTGYQVNNKPTNKSLAGNWNTGFLYTVNWYKPDRLMSLECANKMHDRNILNNMITLAKDIDKLAS